MGLLDPKPQTVAGLDAAVTAKINTPGSATATALSATYVPKWKATTAYLAGDKVLSPAGDVVSAKVNFTSGASYSAANWDLSANVTAKLDTSVAAATYATPAMVTAQLASSSEPANAAANAVGTAMATQNLSWTLVEGTGPGDTTLATLRSTVPSYATAGKFGQGEIGGVLRYQGLAAATGDWTLELWVKSTTIPGANTCMLLTPLGYIGMSNGTGQAFYNDPANKAGPALTDGVFHHVAIVVSYLAGTARTFQGLWVDGVKVIPAAAQLLTTAWTGDLVLGGFDTAGADNTTALFDEVRVSFAPNDYYIQQGTTARYTGTFTPPMAAFAWDAATRFLAHLESATAQIVSATNYPARPANAPGGAVTYIGAASPTGMLTRDRWIQA